MPEWFCAKLPFNSSISKNSARFNMNDKNIQNIDIGNLAMSFRQVERVTDGVQWLGAAGGNV